MSTYTPIASITLASAASSVTFGSIPQTYTDLVVVMSYSRSVSGNGLLRFNGDTGSNYSNTYLLGDGSSGSSSRESNRTNGIISYDSANVQETCLINIMNYANTTTNKTFITRGNDTGLGVISYVNLWRNTGAITSIELRPNSGNWNSGSTFSIYGISTANISTGKAIGGDNVWSDGTYWYHQFKASGTFTPLQSLTVDYLVVAGGAGGGGNNNGGGGGAGGLRSTVTATGGGGSLESALSVTAQAYTITVGAGGAGVSGKTGNDGSNSVFSTITSTGGGGGGRGQGPNAVAGRTGGSGGGAGGETGSQNLNGGTGTTNQGYAGGSNTTAANYGAGGGGGAGAVGGNGNTTKSGDGGAGVAVSITGSSATYGGGGGGAGAGSGCLAGSGGSGGGGAGKAQGSIGDGTAGTANTGGGGGGGGGAYQGAQSGGNGGSGIVIVRYAV
jgi:hypothetical protein